MDHRVFHGCEEYVALCGDVIAFSSHNVMFYAYIILVFRHSHRRWWGTVGIGFAVFIQRRLSLATATSRDEWTIIRSYDLCRISVQNAGGCHSHRLHSHSCDRGSKLWPALFGSLTVDHANFWPLTFDRSDFLPAKKSRYLNCNTSPRGCMLGNKRSEHV